MKKKEYIWASGLVISSLCEFSGIMLMAINEGGKIYTNELLPTLLITLGAVILPIVVRIMPIKDEALRMRMLKPNRSGCLNVGMLCA